MNDLLLVPLFQNFSRLDNLRQHKQTVHAYETYLTKDNRDSKLLIERSKPKKKLKQQEKNSTTSSTSSSSSSSSPAQAQVHINKMGITPTSISSIHNQYYANNQYQGLNHPHLHHHNNKYLVNNNHNHNRECLQVI